MLTVGEGSLVRLPATVGPDEEPHETFRTERIANGLRVGTVLGRVSEVCENGCCIWVTDPVREDWDPEVLRANPEDIRPLREDDCRYEIRAPEPQVEEQPDLQGLRSVSHGPFGGGPLPDAAQSEEGAPEEAQGAPRLQQALSIEERYDRLVRRIFERRGNHDHDGSRTGCVQCMLIREMGLQRPGGTK